MRGGRCVQGNGDAVDIRTGWRAGGYRGSWHLNVETQCSVCNAARPLP